MRRKPLEVLAQAALDLAAREPANAGQILSAVAKAMTAYDKFLALLGDEGDRKRLEELTQDAIDSDSLFKHGREISHEFRDGIDAIFFDGDQGLARLTRHYGVF